MLSLSRRSLLLGAAALALTARSAAGQAPAAAFSAITVDVTPLRLQGHGPFADIVHDVILAELRRRLAPRLAAGGPRLVVRMTGLGLKPNVGGGGGFPSSGSASGSDYLEGVALIVGPQGAILGQVPQLLSMPPSAAGTAWYLPGEEQRRAAFLAQTYAQWLQRRIA